MGNNQQTFTNNFNNYENTRFDVGIAMLMTLFSKENQDMINEKIRKQLVDVRTIEDSDSAIKGMVYGEENDDIDKSRIFYVKHNFNKVAYSWHMMVHELAHFIGKPDKETIENEINSNADKSELGGTQIFDFKTNIQYGTFFNECGADLLAEMAMTTLKECRDTNPEIKSTDDIIYTNNRYQKTDYDSLSTIARLMVVAMDNNFSNQSYDKMIHSDSGLIDRQVQMINSETGEIFDTVPTNDYLYGMAGHGKHLEAQFDKYSQEGTYREMCAFLDEEVKLIQAENGHKVDKDKIKGQMLIMADMVNNKMYILQKNNCITEEQKNAFVGRFNLVFNQALQEYGIGPLTQEDLEKTTKSMLQMQSENTNEFEFPEGFSINEFGEIIRPEREETQEQQNDNTFPIVNESFSFKQRIAQMLRKSDFLMNLPFIEKFVDKQLNILPPTIQEKSSTINESRQNLLNWLSNNGEFRNFSPVQRMSAPQKIEQMRNKMEQKDQKNNDGIGLE